MSEWSEKKQVIGLGGSAGTGKDAVMQMLKSMGVYTIDSDEIANRIILKGAPGCQPILESFGDKVLDQTGQMDRDKIYSIVRTDRHASDTL